MSPVVDLVGVEKVFRDFWGRPRVRALSPLTLSLEQGEVLALLGPNGAGKSTTIKLILGLLFPSRGALTVFGRRPDHKSVRARIGYLPEETKLHAFLTAAETLALFGRLHGVPPRERARRVSELLAMVGLGRNEHRPVGEFSKGMARRIGLAVALMGDPDLLILDEPTSGLDPLGTREIKDLIAELRARGRTILLSSHLLDDVEDVADRVGILYGGRLVRLGATRELLTQGERVRIEFARPPGFDPKAAALDVQAQFQVPGEVSVDNPAARLEVLFREVVEAAARERADISGAQVGGELAAFLGGAQSPARAASPPVETATPASPPAVPPAATAGSAAADAPSAELARPAAAAASPVEPARPAAADASPVESAGSATDDASSAEPATSASGDASPAEAPTAPTDAAAPAEAPAASPAPESETPAGRAVLSGLLAPAAAPPAPADAPAVDPPQGREVLEGLLAPRAAPTSDAPAPRLTRGQGRAVLGALTAREAPAPEPAEEPPAPTLSAKGRDVLDGLVERKPRP